jgi:hypothetical protein
LLFLVLYRYINLFITEKTAMAIECSEDCLWKSEGIRWNPVAIPDEIGSIGNREEGMNVQDCREHKKAGGQ